MAGDASKQAKSSLRCSSRIGQGNFRLLGTRGRLRLKLFMPGLTHFGGRLFEKGLTLHGDNFLWGKGTYLLCFLNGDIRFHLHLQNVSTASSIGSFSSLISWIAPTKGIPRHFSFGSENRALSGFLMIARLTNGKWFWFVESDSTRLSTRGKGGVVLPPFIAP